MILFSIVTVGISVFLRLFSFSRIIERQEKTLVGVGRTYTNTSHIAILKEVARD